MSHGASKGYPDFFPDPYGEFFTEYYSHLKDPTGVFGFGPMECPEVSPWVNHTKNYNRVRVRFYFIEKNDFSGCARVFIQTFREKISEKIF